MLSIIEDRVRISSGPMSKRKVGTCIIMVVVPNNIPILYVSFAVSVITLVAERNSSGSTNELAQSRRFFVLFISVLIFYKRRNLF